MRLKQSLTLSIAIVACICQFLAATLADAQTPPPTLSPDEITARISAVHPKTLVLVFDVSESTRTGGVFQNERAASASFIKIGCSTGDRVVLMEFGAGLAGGFDQVLSSPADADSLIDKLPLQPAPGRGTNIRWPHHEALKLIAAGLPRPGVIVLLTDSYNDQPLTTDPVYTQYLQYYTLKGLTVYPHSPQNRDYEHVLQRLLASGKLQQYGVGIAIAHNGRPIERIPTAGEGDAAAEASLLQPTVTGPVGEEKPRFPTSWIIAIVAACVAALVLIVVVVGNRPIPLQLTLGTKGNPRDYRLKPGAGVCLGGTLGTATGGSDAFPLAGLPKPAATIRAVRGGLVLQPADIPDGVKVFHNGMRLERVSPLRKDDEVRITTSDTPTEIAREHRIRVTIP